MKSRAEHPEMAVIIISGYDESMMELEASRYQAEFVAKPIRPAAFLATVAECLAGVRRQRRWPRKRVVGGFRVTAEGAAGRRGGRLLRWAASGGADRDRIDGLLPGGARRGSACNSMCSPSGSARPTTGTTRYAAP